VLSSLVGIERLTLSGRTPALPEGVRIYAIGDIHGRLDLLERLLSQTSADLQARPVDRPLYVFLGDYIDRGPSSRETIDRLIAHGGASESIFLRGNHEQVAIRCLTDPGLFEQWMRLGGLETLVSFGIVPHAEQPQAIAELQAAFHAALSPSHLRFFRELRRYFECGDFFFAHAGVRPGIDLSRQKENDLLWIREEFLASAEDFGKIVVHGHTPERAVQVQSNRIGIDTGAFATGCLTCLVIEGRSLSLIDTGAIPGA
jgi:diadenosine tetraphosphatase ApaH/serine/threonine PP2A family protein phosphatase